ncbi:MAG: serine/threonine-protein kinase [Acidobacteriota bacterium]
MSATRFARVKEVFLQAVELEAGARTSFLEGACAGDAPLRREVDALIASDAEDLGLERPVVEQAVGLLEAQRPEPTGQRIGAYRLLHEIGRGGMSTVYLAVRDDDQYQQRVAIKLIRDGLGSDDRRRRFLQERQILAGLDHPNIARLLDGGTTEEGLPYVVLEYVEGVAIDAYCERHRLAVEERLGLFRDVCSAVHAAHQNLVIHRDLKPGNVLVTAAGIPKLLDFGIAKLLNPELSASDLRTTLPMSRLMTPAYASPEQIRGEPVTTATDVYSLGVMLYELLTGDAPYALAGADQDEIERLVCETEPRPPSTVVAPAQDSAESPNDSASRPRVSPDLDAIVLMALRKQPRRRYGSAVQLGDDLNRYLRDLPVRARRDTFAYRSRKFLRRNRLAAALAAAAGVFSVAMTVQTLRLGGALERTREQEQEARQQRDRAERVSDFLVQVFRTSDPSEALGQKVTARQLLDQARRRIGAELAEQPVLKAALMDTMGTAYQNLGFLDEADSLLTRAFEMRQQRVAEANPGRADAEVADSLSHLAFLSHLKEEFETAEDLGRQALAMRRELYGERHREVAESLHDLAEVLFASGQWQASEALYREALDLRRDLLGARHRAVAESLNELSMLLRATNRFAEAEATAREALAIWQELFGEEHPGVATALENLALARLDQRDLEAAEELLHQALAIKQRLLGEEHPGVADTASELASVLQLRGETRAAEALLRRNLNMALSHWGADSPRVANHQSRLAAVLSDLGEYPAAIDLTRQALATYRETFGPEHPWTALLTGNLARAVKTGGDPQEATTLYRETIELWRQLEPEGSWDLAYALLELGRLQAADPVAAEPLLRESVEMMRRVLPGHWRVAEAEVELGLGLARLGHRQEAEALLDGRLERLEGKLPAGEVEVLRERLSGGA